MDNVYQTNDPKKLLQLKRLEADALLDVIRTVNHYEHPIKKLCRIAHNVLIAQIGVRKMTFFFQGEKEWETGFSTGFDLLGKEASDELFAITHRTQIEHDTCPALAAQQVEYVIPINNRDDIFGYFLIADFADDEVEAENDIIFIETLGNILAVAILNRQLFNEKMEQEFLRKELEVAETIQQQLLISDFSGFREMDVFGFNQAHHGIGGDFYDVIKKGKGTTFVCIADVSGKGIAAALLMSNLQANLRALCAQFDAPADIVRELNKILYGITMGEKFVTLFLARIDTHLSSFTFVNAGHNYPLFINKGKVINLETGCMLLGILEEIDPVEGRYYFEEGDVLFMFTDGLVEQSNERGEMFSSDRTVEVLISQKTATSFDLIKKMQTAVDEFAGAAEVPDDVTMLSVKFLSDSK